MRRVADWGFGVRLGLLTLAVVVAYGLAMLVATALVGASGDDAPSNDDVWKAAAIAAGVCWMGAAAAMTCAAWLGKPHLVLWNVLAGMTCRMVPALAAVASMKWIGTRWIEAGVG